MPPHHSVQGKKKVKKAEPKPKKKSMKAKKALLPVSVEDSEEEDHSEVEKKAEAEDGDAFKIKYILEIILVLLQPFAKRLALPDSEINKTQQNPILGFGSSLAHPLVTGPFLIIKSV